MSLNAVKSVIENSPIKLIIWDFDGVIYDLDWNFSNTPSDFLNELYGVIHSIDDSIIQDKKEFILRLFPYPEISEIGKKYGKSIQDKILSIYEEKESSSIHKAIPNYEVISFIKNCHISQSIWSNNLSSTIVTLLKKDAIREKIDVIASLDKVISSKPHTEGFQIIKNNYPEIDEKNILFVGDSLRSDKVAADGAGIGFVHYHK